MIKIVAIFIVLFCGVCNGVFSSQNNDENTTHTLTLYFMPTKLPLDWSGPANLYRSAMRNYTKTFSNKYEYLIGHVAVEFNSPLLDEPFLGGMSVADRTERVNLVLKDRVGFGILGAPLKGRIETREELEERFDYYHRNHRLAFLKFVVNEDAARKMVEFLSGFTQKTETGYSGSDFYGGAFNPRYRNEGGGCSAFAFAFLEIARLEYLIQDDWLVDVKIPMVIVGGDFNKGKRIKLSTIRKNKKWYHDEGVENDDYVSFSVYDPSLVYEWILNKRLDTDSIYVPHQVNGIPGLMVNAQSQAVDPVVPVFSERTGTNLFINHFYERYLQGSFVDEQ